jgi:mRNA interferase MazF
VQSDGAITGLSQKLVALITSNLNRTGETRVAVTKNSALGEQMKLQSDSVIVTDNLATILDRTIDKVIGHCSSMELVNEALRKALEL